MAQVNPFFIKKEKKYLFFEIAKRVAKYPPNEIINLGIGDVAKPICPAIVDSLHHAASELGHEKTFKGYGPGTGYSFLKEAILNDGYKSLGFSKEEIFISDGICPDLSDLEEMFSPECSVGIQDPAYPLYLDISEWAGRKIHFLRCEEKTGFFPLPPTDFALDLIYLCSPHNPTGVAYTREQLSSWVDYAKTHHSVILFDAAYEAFIRSPNVPTSIYEIPGAKEVAIELKSFSKSAGLSGVRCAYSVIPKELILYHQKQAYPLYQLWEVRQETKTNGVSYLSQKAALAALTPEGKKQTKAQVDDYLESLHKVKKTLEERNQQVWGGKDSPYLWWKIPTSIKTWDFFDMLLDRYRLVTVPGSGFGSTGEGYVRLSGFISRETADKACETLNQLDM